LRNADARSYNEEQCPGRSGPKLSPRLPGRPESSYCFCAWQDRGGCEAWTWSARYGQYTVLLKYEGNVANRPQALSNCEFATLVQASATQVDRQLSHE